MNEIKIFDHPMFGNLRTVMHEGQPMFVGVDVTRALEYVKPSQAVIDHCKGIRKLGIPSAKGEQETNCIPEGDLYRLIYKAAEQSRNPVIKEKAERFERWVFDEVLPGIRKHGMYATAQTVEQMLADPGTMITVLQALMAEQQQRQALEIKVERDAPKVLFAESVQASKGSISVGEMAKLLKQNGANTGRDRLYETLRKDGYLCTQGESYNLPTQKAMEMGLFDIKKLTIHDSGGSPRVKRTTMVTGKGQVYFMNRYRVQAALEG